MLMYQEVQGSQLVQQPHEACHQGPSLHTFPLHQPDQAAAFLTPEDGSGTPRFPIRAPGRMRGGQKFTLAKSAPLHQNTTGFCQLVSLNCPKLSHMITRQELWRYHSSHLKWGSANEEDARGDPLNHVRFLDFTDLGKCL